MLFSSLPYNCSCRVEYKKKAWAEGPHFCRHFRQKFQFEFQFEFPAALFRSNYQGNAGSEFGNEFPLSNRNSRAAIYNRIPLGAPARIRYSGTKKPPQWGGLFQRSFYTLVSGASVTVYHESRGRAGGAGRTALDGLETGLAGNVSIRLDSGGLLPVESLPNQIPHGAPSEMWLGRGGGE